MPFEMREIPYGRASPGAPGPHVCVAGDVPLRLAHGPYPFDEPPDLVRTTGVADRMALLAEHLKSLCGPWDKLSRLFIDAYFAAVADAVAAAGDELDGMVRRAGGLFAPEDWSFCALRPLPQAHLAADGSACAALGFWTGRRFVAIAVEGSASLGREERARQARIEAAGAELIRVPAASLTPGRFTLTLLPPEFARFWAGVPLPASPFVGEGLAAF